MYILLLFGEFDVSYIKLLNDAVEFSYALTDFSACWNQYSTFLIEM